MFLQNWHADLVTWDWWTPEWRCCYSMSQTLQGTALTQVRVTDQLSLFFNCFYLTCSVCIFWSVNLTTVTQMLAASTILFYYLLIFLSWVRMWWSRDCSSWIYTLFSLSFLLDPSLSFFYYNVLTNTCSLFPLWYY